MTRLISLPPMLQKAIALLILIGLVLAINSFILSPLFSTQNAQLRSSANSSASIERIAALSTNAPLIRENLRDVLQDKRFASGLLPPSSEPQAAAAVQARVRKCIQQAGGEIRAITSIPSEPNGSLMKIGVSVTSTMSLSDFDAVLSQLESGQPNLFIESADIQVSPTNRRTLPTDSASPTPLIFRLEIVGFARRDGAS